MNRLRLKKNLAMSLRSLQTQKLRAALSALGVVIGVAAVFALVCVGEGAKRQALKQIESLGITNIIIHAKQQTGEQRGKARAQLSQGLRIYDMEKIERGVPSAEAVYALKEVAAQVIGGERETSPKIAAVTADYGAIRRFPLRAGRFISRQDLEMRNLICVLGDGVAKSLGAEGKVNGRVRINEIEYKVVGVLRKYDLAAAKSSPITQSDYNQMIFIPLGTEPQLKTKRNAPPPRGNVGEIVVRIDKEKNVMAAARIIKRILDITHSKVEDYSLIVPQELLRNAMETRKNFRAALAAIALISLLVGGVGIMNIMLANVSERKKEIGVRRVVGASRKDIMTQFLGETVALTSVGGAIGIAAGLFLAFAISFFSEWEVAIVPWALVLAVIMSAVVGIFSGLYPAYNAAKVDPIEAIRS